jgi:hypothetical protein
MQFHGSYVHADQHSATSAKSPLTALLSSPVSVRAETFKTEDNTEKKPTLKLFVG